MPLLDAASIQLEGRDMPMHVAGLLTFEFPSNLSDSERKGFISDLVSRWRNDNRIHYPWNQVLTRATRWQVQPATKDIYDLDLEYHVRQWSLPAPGGERELGQMVAWIHELPMDLRKPLWECHFIEGLSGNRFALYVKMHHALVDGISATRLLVGGLPQEEGDVPGAPFWTKPQPDHPIRPDRMPLPSFADLKTALTASLKLRGDHDPLTTFASAPRSILNGAIGAHRRVATQSFEMDRLKRVAKARDASLNDVVMAIVGGALRDYLLDADALPEESLTAALPVSTRKPGDTSIGNQVSMIFGTLGTDIADPAERLEQVKASTRAGKSMVQELPPSALLPYSLFSTGPYLSSVILGRAGKAKPIFNTVVSNVPGHRETRYLNGARLQHVYPVSLIMPGVPLNFTCVSHENHLNFGIVACRDRVPRVQRVAVGMAKSLAELEQAVL